MLSTHNIFSPANGKPIISASQDIVMGVYFITYQIQDEKAEKDLPKFKDRREAILAYQHGKIHLQERIVVRMDGFDQFVDNQSGGTKPLPANNRLVTTVGRVLFSDILQFDNRSEDRTGPQRMPFYNCALGKKGCARVIDDVYAVCGRSAPTSVPSPRSVACSSPRSSRRACPSTTAPWARRGAPESSTTPTPTAAAPAPSTSWTA
jgi:DNA-directed RNA polymerase subunit beta'